MVWSVVEEGSRRRGRRRRRRENVQGQGRGLLSRESSLLPVQCSGCPGARVPVSVP